MQLHGPISDAHPCLLFCPPIFLVDTLPLELYVVKEQIRVLKVQKWLNIVLSWESQETDENKVIKIEAAVDEISRILVPSMGQAFKHWILHFP